MRFQYRIIPLLSIIIVVIIAVNAIGLIVLGIQETYHAWGMVFNPEHRGPEDRPGLMMMESVDIFLVALVLLIFSQGIYILFVRDPAKEIDSRIPNWMQVNSFGELKFLLIETVIVSLFIGFVSFAFKMNFDLVWTGAILPGCILLLSLSMFFMKKAKK